MIPRRSFFIYENSCQNIVDKVVWVAKKVLVLCCSVTWNIVDVTKGKAEGGQKGGIWDTCPKLGGMFWCPDKTEQAPRTRNILASSTVTGMPVRVVTHHASRFHLRRRTRVPVLFHLLPEATSKDPYRPLYIHLCATWRHFPAS